MRKNCRRTCLQCADIQCKDSNKNCALYDSYGYCHRDHKYFNFMKKTCSKSCRFCLSTAEKPRIQNLTKQFKCDFEQNECDWENQHVEDTSDWKVGLTQNGPNSGYNNSASYLYIDAPYPGYNAYLWLPWQLVLPDGTDEKGRMCLNFLYQLNDGELTVKQSHNPSVTNKIPKPNVLFSTNEKVTSWTHAQINTFVSSRYYLLLMGKKGRPYSYIVIDDIYFTDGGC